MIAHLTAADLDEIEQLAASDAADGCRDPLLALVAEVRRLRRAMYCESFYPTELPKYGGCESR